MADRTLGDCSITIRGKDTPVTNWTITTCYKPSHVTHKLRTIVM